MLMRLMKERVGLWLSSNLLSMCGHRVTSLCDTPHNLYYYGSYLMVIGVHEMCGRVYPNYCLITILLVYTVKPLIMDSPSSGQPPNNGQMP